MSEEFLMDMGIQGPNEMVNFIPATTRTDWDIKIRGIGRNFRGLGGDPEWVLTTTAFTHQILVLPQLRAGCTTSNASRYCVVRRVLYMAETRSAVL